MAKTLGDVMASDGVNGATATYEKDSNDSGDGKDGAVKRMEIEVTDNGGFVVKCYHDQGPKGPMDISSQKCKTHSVSDVKELDALIDDTFGMSEAYDSKGDDAGADDTGDQG